MESKWTKKKSHYYTSNYNAYAIAVQDDRNGISAENVKIEFEIELTLNGARYCSFVISTNTSFLMIPNTDETQVDIVE